MITGQVWHRSLSSLVILHWRSGRRMKKAVISCCYDQSLRSGSQPTMCTIRTRGDLPTITNTSSVTYFLQPASTSYNSLLPANDLLNFNQWINILQIKDIIISTSLTQPHRHTQRCAFTVQVVLSLIKMTTRRSHHNSPHTQTRATMSLTPW